MAKISLKQVLANIYSEWPSTTKRNLADKKLRIYIQFYICGYKLVNFIKKFTIWKFISKNLETLVHFFPVEKSFVGIGRNHIFGVQNFIRFLFIYLLLIL
jgi:hypothetical protein